MSRYYILSQTESDESQYFKRIVRLWHKLCTYPLSCTQILTIFFKNCELISPLFYKFFARHL